MQVFARQGDTVDSLCWRHFRRTAGITEQVLELNPGLAAAAILPEGTIVKLPDTPALHSIKMVQLWDQP